MQTVRREAQSDRAYQAFLNPAACPSGAAQDDGNRLSAAQAQVGGDTFEVTATRAIQAVSGEVAGVTTSAVLTPYSTGIKAGGALGEGGPELAGVFLAGKKAKTVGIDGGTELAAAGAAISLVTDSRIEVLGPPIQAQDGKTRQLARFRSLHMPILDLNLSGVAAEVGFGARAVVASGREATYTKFVDTAELARMMRKRSSWMRPVTDTLKAVRPRRALGMASPEEAAKDLTQVDLLLPGESMAWKSSRAMLLGLAAGTHGLRATATLQLQTSAIVKIERTDANQVRLTVQPTRLRGAKLGLEARLVADLSVAVVRAATKLRAWEFDLSLASARHALARALDGHLPGILPNSAQQGPRQAFAMLATDRAERIPMGVAAKQAAAAQLSEVVGGSSGIKLPEILGGYSLAAYRSSSYRQVAASDVQTADYRRIRERSSSYSLLSLGEVVKSNTAEIQSAVSIGPRGEMVVEPQTLSTTLLRETSGSSKFGRNRIAADISDLVGDDISLSAVKPTRRYAVEVTYSVGIGELTRVSKLSEKQLTDLAESYGLPKQMTINVAREIRQGIVAGDEQSYAAVLSRVVDRGHDGFNILRTLTRDPNKPAKDLAVDIRNETHDELMTRFFKAEAYALGAQTQAHAREVVERLSRLEKDIADAVKENEGDGIVLSMTSGHEVAQRTGLLVVLMSETRQLRADVETAMVA